MMSDAPTWFASSIGRGQHLTLAGCWYAFVSLPILRFILLRWYFRLFVWYDSSGKYVPFLCISIYSIPTALAALVSFPEVCLRLRPFWSRRQFSLPE